MAENIYVNRYRGSDKNVYLMGETEIQTGKEQK